MARKAGGFGFVILLVVVAVVLILVARSWSKFAPAAVSVNEAASSTDIAPHGETEAAAALRSGKLPRLGEARKAAAQHIATTQEALATPE